MECTIINMLKMKNKLTLTIEQEVIIKAKDYAKCKNQSISHIIENYLRSLTKGTEKTKKKMNPVVKSLRGSFTMPKDMDYKKELRERVEKKFL